MNKRKNQESNPNEYRTWKKKEEAPKEVNMASFSDFPDLIKSDTKKTVFAGTSLATKLKEVIAAEEDAAIMRRLKKNNIQDTIREGFAILPLSSKSKMTTDDINVPDWMMDGVETECFPSYKHKSLDQIAKERKWKRYGVNPRKVMLYDIEEPEYVDDKVSLPDTSLDTEVEEEDVIEMEQS